MKWREGRRSNNVEDRRGDEPVGFGGAQGPMRGMRVGGSLGTLVVIAVLMYMGVIDPNTFFRDLASSPSTAPPSAGAPQPDPTAGGGPADSNDAGSAAEDDMRDFVSVVLGDTEDTWSDLFQKMGRDYEEPVLVLFSGAVESACGFTQAAVGPFYCPGDHKVYIDLSFYDDLRNRFHAPGDFAQAYVIAHEVGHHVQNLLGISAKVTSAMQSANEIDRNRLSVKLELQADCLAGVWAFHAQRARGILESGDIEEGLRAASSIGDDRLQMQARGYTAPESFTHGSSEQRVQWFRRGIDKGDLNRCNTFDEGGR